MQSNLRCKKDKKKVQKVKSGPPKFLYLTLVGRRGFNVLKLVQKDTRKKEFVLTNHFLVNNKIKILFVCGKCQVYCVYVLFHKIHWSTCVYRLTHVLTLAFSIATKISLSSQSKTHTHRHTHTLSLSQSKTHTHTLSLVLSI